MRDSSFPLTTWRVIAVVLMLSCRSACLAQPAPAPFIPPAPSSDDSSADDDDSLNQGSHSSFSPPRNQSVIQCFEVIHDAFKRSDYTAALPLMERVLSEPDSFVPTGASTEVAAREEVRRLIQKLPADLRQRLETPRRALAQKMWDQAIQNGTEEIAEFLRDFGDLPLAVEAWWWIGCRERDLGRPLLAAEAFRRVADHPYCSEQQLGVALMARHESFVNANRPAQAAVIRGRLLEMAPNLKVTVAGRTLELRQWLDQHRVDPAATVSDPSSAATNDRLRRPVSTPTWKHPFTIPLGAALATQEQRQRDQDVRPIPILRPLIVNETIVVRKLEGIYAFNLADGVSRWIIPNTEFREIDRRQLLENGSLQTTAVEVVQRRTLADSIFAQMTTDGKRLFVVQDPDRIGEWGIDRDASRLPVRRGPQFNKLCGYSLQTNALEWEIGGTATGANDTFGGYFFLGPPLVMDDILFVVAQRGSELRLMAIEPTHGTLEWSLVLGSALLPIKEDLQRSRVACPVVFADGLLVCSTSAGALVAVDPFLKTLKWSYRYPAATFAIGDQQNGPFAVDTNVIREPWWNAWREPFAVVSRSKVTGAGSQRSGGSPSADSILIFASPETDLLHAITLPEGRPLWKVPRNGGLIVAGISEDVVIVIEGESVRAHDLGSGQVRWRTLTGEVRGTGAFAGSMLVLPAQIGGTILLDTRTGELVSEPASTETALGALVETDSGWVAYNRGTLLRLPKLKDVRDSLERELQTDPNDESLRVRAAFLDLQAGDTVMAQGRLEGLKSSPARELRRQALIGALQEFDRHRLDADRSELARQLKELAEDVDYKFSAAASIGRSALAVEDLTSVVDIALDGLTADLDQPDALVKSSSSIVRKDRVLLGLIDEAYRRASVEQQPLLEELFEKRVQEAIKSRDRQSVQRLAQQWRGLDWSRRLLVLEDDKALRKRTPIEAELRLLDAAGSNDASIGLQALDKLVARFDRANATREAQELRLRMLREFPATRFPNGETEEDRIKHDPELEKSVYAPAKPGWSESAPIEKSRDDRNFGIYHLIPMHAEPGSLAEKLDVWIDRNGTELLFRGESFFQAGQDEDHERKFPLPPSTSPLRGIDGYMLREAWGVGRIIIVMVGSELFAISPLDEQGEPISKFLWSNSVELQSSGHNTRVVRQRAQGNGKRQVVVDDSNRQVGKVGPVRPGYLCYQKGTKLVAIETETGRELWQRLDFPADATVLGDDHSVFVWRQGKTIEVLSAIDGRKLEERVCPYFPQNMIHSRGALVWTVTYRDQVQTELYDLQKGETLWTRTDVEGSQVALLDQETLAIATPGDALQILAARTGKPLCEKLPVKSGKLNGIVTWRDLDRWYVALTEATKDVAAIKALQPKESYRVRFLKGTLYGLDRRDPRILWQRELKDEPMALDQSCATPVLVQLWKQLPKMQGGSSEGMLRIIDKRTGKPLIEKSRLDMPPYFLLNPDPQQGIVELRLARETIQLVYSTDSNAADQPHADDK